MNTLPSLEGRARQAIARAVAPAASAPVSAREQTWWIAARFAAGEAAEGALVALAEASAQAERFPEMAWALAEARLGGEALVAFVRACLAGNLYQQSYGPSHEGRSSWRC